MDANLLRSWIGLPPGPWPPGDRELLGLPAGAVNPAEAERRVMERMALLRPHQLLHPELVTEGMNRLAQALLAVTAFAPAPEDFEAIEEFEELGDVPTVAAADVFEVDLQGVVAEAPAIVEAEPVVEAEVVSSRPTTPAPTPRGRRTAGRTGPATPTLIPTFTDLPIIPVPEPRPGDRRSISRELAGLRAIRRSLDRLRPILGNPHEKVSSPGQVLVLLEGAREFTLALRHRGLDLDRFRSVAPIMTGIVAEPLVLAVFRSLGSSQRIHLAREWAAVRTWLDSYSACLRGSLGSLPRAGRSASGGRFRYLGQRPEWLLAAMTILVLAITGIWAFLR